MKNWNRAVAVVPLLCRPTTWFILMISRGIKYGQDTFFSVLALFLNSLHVICAYALNKAAVTAKYFLKQATL